MGKRVCLAIVLMACSAAWGADDWLTDGVDQQRTAWQRDETILSKDNIKSLQIIWKIKLDNEPRGMHSLLPTLIVSGVPTASGRKEIAISAGVSDNIFAIDVETGKLLWQKHFEYTPYYPPPTGRADVLCPGGQTATPTIGPANASGGRTLYAIDGGGNLRQLNVANGDELSAPIPYSWPNGKPYALNMWNNILFTTTGQGCGGKGPNQIWAINVTDPTHKVMTFNPGSGGLWGRRGAAIDSDGVAYAPTGDGIYDLESHMYGDGLVGAKVDGDQLKLYDYFIPSDWPWMLRRDLDMNVTPAIFTYKGRELMVTSSKECRVWLLDTKSPGGQDHQTPLYQTPLMCNVGADFARGVWGALATWEDSDGTRWILAPFGGIENPDFKVPISHGPVTRGAVVAFKLEEKDHQLQLIPAWISHDIDFAEPPVVANGVVYSYASGEDHTQATAQTGIDPSAERRVVHSTHATVFALDARTGEELYSSGDQITSWDHFTGLSIANGHVYLGTFDGTLYCFGLPAQNHQP